LDLRQKSVQSGNAAEATGPNAVAEGVANRVEFHTADVAALPLADGGFDVVLSSVAVHNVKSPAVRDRAIGRAVRLLRPGGRLLIADIFATCRDRDRLAVLGMTDVARRGLVWRMWWSGPRLPTRLVTATKPPSQSPKAAGESNGSGSKRSADDEFWGVALRKVGSRPESFAGTVQTSKGGCYDG
jgi:SAM-dependent methyltransferase